MYMHEKYGICLFFHFYLLLFWCGCLSLIVVAPSLQWGKWERKQEYDLISMDEMENTGEDIHIALMYWLMFKHK